MTRNPCASPVGIQNISLFSPDKVAPCHWPKVGELRRRSTATSLTLAGATALTVKSSSPNNVQGQTSTTYIFDAATVVTIETVAPSAQLGVMSLTYRSSSPASLFANQRIVGFYRDASWKTCLGVPIYDYAGGNIADNEMGKRRVPQPPLPIKRRLPFRPWESIPRCQLPHSRIPSLARAHPVRPPPRLNCS